MTIRNKLLINFAVVPFSRRGALVFSIGANYREHEAKSSLGNAL